MALLAATTAAYALLLGPVVRFLVTGGAQGLERAFALVPPLAALDRAQALMALPVWCRRRRAQRAGLYSPVLPVGMAGQRAIAGLRRDYLASLLRQDARLLRLGATGDCSRASTADLATSSAP
jgi:hypothetical protein